MVYSCEALAGCDAPAAYAAGASFCRSREGFPSLKEVSVIGKGPDPMLSIWERYRSLGDALLWGTKAQVLWNTRNLLVLVKEMTREHAEQTTEK